MYLFDDFNDNSLDTNKWAASGNVTESGQELVIAVGTAGWNNDGVSAKTAAQRIANDTVKLDVKASSTFCAGLLPSTTLAYLGNPGLTFIFNNTDKHIDYYLDSSGPTYTGYDWANGTYYTLEFKFKSGGGWTVTINGGVHSNQVILDTASGGGSSYYLQAQKLYGTTNVDNAYLSGSGGSDIVLFRRRREGC
jgi:hypothetical protein